MDEYERLWDEYEKRWRERAASRGLQDVDWYVYTPQGYKRFPDLDSADRAVREWLVQSDWKPACGRGANCSEIAPTLCCIDHEHGGWVTAVEAMLEDEYDD